MTLTQYLKKFPLILEKGSEYYLYSGIVNELEDEELISILHDVFTKEILKRKIIYNRIEYGLAEWPQKLREDLFTAILEIYSKEKEYRKLESIAKTLVLFIDYLPSEDKKTLVIQLINSEYRNNRKRGYQILKKYWFDGADAVIIKAWQEWKDDFLLPAALKNMPLKFLEKNNSDFLDLFNEEGLEYDFNLLRLRNQYLGRTFTHNQNIIEEIKPKDGLSYIYILLSAGKPIDYSWAYEFYKKHRKSRSLARTLGKLGVWRKLIGKGIDPRTGK